MKKEFTDEEIKNAVKSFRVTSYNLNKEKFKEYYGRDLKEGEVVFMNGQFFGHPDDVDKANAIFLKMMPTTSSKFSDFNEKNKGTIVFDIPKNI